MQREEDSLDYEIGKREELLYRLHTELKDLEHQSYLLPYDPIREIEGRVADSEILV